MGLLRRAYAALRGVHESALRKAIATVPIRIDRNGGNLVALISTMMLAMASSTQNIRRVS